MPRYEFNNEAEFEAWAVSNLTGDRYNVIITNKGEVVAVPTKSTQPLIYGYLNVKSKEKAKQFTSKFYEQYGTSLILMKKFVWSSEREPQDE